MPHSITLKAGYTQKDLFLAAIEVQLTIFVNDGVERNFESPKITFHENADITLESEKYSSTNTNKFNKAVDEAEKGDWKWLHTHCPNWEQAEGVWSINQKNLILYASTLIQYFEDAMKEFLSEKIKREIRGLGIPYKKFLPATARVFISIFSPFKNIPGVFDENKCPTIINFFSDFSEVDFKYASEEDALKNYYEAVQENILRYSKVLLMRPFDAIQFLNKSIDQFSEQLRDLEDKKEMEQIFSSNEFYRLLSEAVAQEDKIGMRGRLKNTALEDLVKVMISLPLCDISDASGFQDENSNFKKDLIADIKKISDFGAKNSFLFLLESNFPAYLSFRFIGAIAEAKCARKTFRNNTQGRNFYKKLICFSGIRLSNEVAEFFKKYRNEVQEKLNHGDGDCSSLIEDYNSLCPQEKLQALMESLEKHADCKYSIRSQDTFFDTFELPKIVEDWMSEIKASSSGCSFQMLGSKAEEFLQYSENTHHDCAVRSVGQEIKAFINHHFQLSVGIRQHLIP